MIKYVYIITILTPMVILKAQNDSLSKKLNWLSHFAGIDIGYSEYGDKTISGYKAETNLNYVFNPHYFIAKVQLGVAPATNFGTLKKGFIGVGFSTKTNKKLSWHLITGVGRVLSSNAYTRNEPGSNTATIKRTYEFYCETFYLETGFYSQPLKHKKFVLGLNAVLSTYTIYNIAYYPLSFYTMLSPNINFSINYNLNR